MSVPNESLFAVVINTNWHPISYRFEVITDYCLHFSQCVLKPLYGAWGLRSNVYWLS